MAVADAPTIAFRDQPAFRTWLAAHHREQDGIWLKLAKKGSGIPSVTYAEAVVVALCFGWIDGQARSVDETSYVQRFTPRRSRSKWSKINIGRVEALVAAGEMTPAGLAEVERAKADGRWAAAYDPPSTAAVPEDLQAALDANPWGQREVLDDHEREPVRDLVQGRRAEATGDPGPEDREVRRRPCRGARALPAQPEVRADVESSPDQPSAQARSATARPRSRGTPVRPSRGSAPGR